MGNQASHPKSALHLEVDALLSRPSALHPSMFSLHATAHHGVPSNARALAFCDLQGILAVGTASGAVKLYGTEGLEVLLGGPTSVSHSVVGVTHLKFTAHQRLVVVYTDSSLRVFDLVSGSALCCFVSDFWKSSTITSLETISYTDYPFFFVATDDGNVHVVHEETGQVSTYVIRPQNLSSFHAEGVTSMACHPTDANLLLLAYDTCSAVLLWNFAKRKVVREFTPFEKAPMLTSSQTRFTSSGVSSVDQELIVNSPQSLSWHSSGKTFVAGYKQGGFAVFLIDKSHGMYRYVTETAPSARVTPVKHIKWVGAPPTSEHATFPGAIVFSGGRVDHPTESKLLTLVYPPSDTCGTDDALIHLCKAETLPWKVATIESVNNAEIAAFEAAQNHADHCTKVAPFSLILLSGNPMDGCLPAVSVQSLPCFIKLCDGDKEKWEWKMNRLPEPTIIPPLLQLSPLRALALVNLFHSESTLQDDLLSTWDQAKYNPMFCLMEIGDFEWPVNGGRLLEPTLQRFLTTRGVLENGASVALNSMILLTGYANGCVMLWEARSAADCSSKGAIRLLHVVDVPLQMPTAPVNPEITCLTFCADSRILGVGFASGEIAVLQLSRSKEYVRVSLANEQHQHKGSKSSDSQRKLRLKPDDANSSFQDPDQSEAVGFCTLFSIHAHTEPITKVVVSSFYGYVGVADAAGIVSLVDIKTQKFQLLVCEIAPAVESMSVDSLLMSELVQTTEIPGTDSTPSLCVPASNKSGEKCLPGQLHESADNGNFSNGTKHREVIPVLFVGRGSGKVEMYHVQSATKMSDMLVDANKTSSLSSIIMIDSNGERIEITGYTWGKQDEDFGVAESAPHPVDEAVLTVGQRPDDYTQDGSIANECVDARNQQLVRPSTYFELTQQFVMEVKAERLKVGTTDVVPAQAVDTPSWNQKSIIEAVVPPGSLGLYLFTEVEQHAVVKGFVDDSITARLLVSKGIRVGHTLIAINGVDVTSLDREVICRVLEKLREHENLLVFAVGFAGLEISIDDEIGASDGPVVDTWNAAKYERPRFLVCTCGRAIHVIQATVPRAAEMAAGPKEIVAQPLASVELREAVLVASVVRIPVGGGVENCLVVVDQSNHVYVLSLLSLKLIWEANCTDFGIKSGCNGLADGILLDISYSGELVFANAFGEMERFSLLAEPTAIESAMLECMPIKTQLYLPERAPGFRRRASPTVTDSGEKQGITADAGKMLKKLVFSVTRDATNLNEVFHFSTGKDERRRLMGHRTSTVNETTATSETGLSATKNSLVQAQQRLSERGEKLNDLGLKTEQMKKTSEDLYQTMKAFNKKNASKKWYEF